MPEVNWLAVVVAAVASFAVGAVWYSPALFSSAWQREAGMPNEALEGSATARIFVCAFVLMFLATLVFALFLGPSPGLALGAGAGFAAGLFWVAAAFGVNYLFERRSLKLWLINGGYNVLAFTVMGTVLGLLG